MIHLDSSFLVDLHREVLRERPGPAFEWIESLDPNTVLAVSVHVVCELRADVRDFSRIPGLRVLKY
jgi:predicted nucleic acid-binding protein